jgi:hypothetical protein
MLDFIRSDIFQIVNNSVFLTTLFNIYGKKINLLFFLKESENMIDY